MLGTTTLTSTTTRLLLQATGYELEVVELLILIRRRLKLGTVLDRCVFLANKQKKTTTRRTAERGL